MLASASLPKGGFWGHIARRSLHIASIIIPLFYYNYEQLLPQLARLLTQQQLVLSILIVLMILESIRLKQGWTLFGQRKYEEGRISGLTWSLASTFLVLILFNSPVFAVPIVIAYAIGDPLLGELRFRGLSTWIIILMALLVLAIIWWCCLAYYDVTQYWWLIIVMPIVTIAAEWPRLSWIDDNALMQIIPLIVIQVFMLCNLIVLP